jgi:hypothetical protein
LKQRKEKGEKKERREKRKREREKREKRKQEKRKRKEKRELVRWKYLRNHLRKKSKLTVKLPCEIDIHCLFPQFCMTPRGRGLADSCIVHQNSHLEKMSISK